MLLVEFAIVLRKWLRACESGPTDLFYASMDFEEEPIVALRYDASGQFLLQSIWSVAEVGPIRTADALLAAQQYLSQLHDELYVHHGVDLEVALSEALRDG
jgi:hypothetical protein